MWGPIIEDMAVPKRESSKYRPIKSLDDKRVWDCRFSPNLLRTSIYTPFTCRKRQVVDLVWIFEYADKTVEDWVTYQLLIGNEEGV